MLDPDVDEPAEERRRAAVEMDELVLPAPTASRTSPAAGRAAASPRHRRRRGRVRAAAPRSTRTCAVRPTSAVPLEADALLERQERVQAAALLGGRDVVGRRSAGVPGRGENAAAKTWS